MKKKIVICIAIILAAALSVSALLLGKKGPQPTQEESTRDIGVTAAENVLLPLSEIIPDAQKRSEIKLIAHRGLSSVAPENTLLALREAGRAGFYGAEFDIQHTSDGEWVLMHNSSVDAMTDGTGEVSDLSLPELRRLKIDSGNGYREYNEEDLFIPTLAEALAVCREYSLVPFIEIKGKGVHDVSSIVEIINRSGLASTAVIISFNYDYLENFHKNYPEFQLMYLVSTVNAKKLSQCRKISCVLDYNAGKSENESIVARAAAKGIVTAAWTVDSAEVLMPAYELGCRYFTTNRIIP